MLAVQSSRLHAVFYDLMIPELYIYVYERRSTSRARTGDLFKE
jgi:hypothetical protein